MRLVTACSQRIRNGVRFQRQKLESMQGHQGPDAKTCGAACERAQGKVRNYGVRTTKYAVQVFFAPRRVRFLLKFEIP